MLRFALTALAPMAQKANARAFTSLSCIMIMRMRAAGAFSWFGMNIKRPFWILGHFFAIFGRFLAHFGPEVKLARCEIPNTSTSLVVGNLGLQLHATAVGIGTKKTAGTCISTQERPLCLKKPMAYRHRSWSPHPQPKAEFAHFFRAPLSLQRHRRPSHLPCAVWAPHRAYNIFLFGFLG